MNLANLYLVHGRSRRFEYAVRGALGADRGRLFRQLLTETAFLSLLGASIGIAVAAAAIGGMRDGPLAELPRVGELTLDGSVAAFALGLSIATALVFAWIAARSLGATALRPSLARRILPGSSL